MPLAPDRDIAWEKDFGSAAYRPVIRSLRNIPQTMEIPDESPKNQFEVEAEERPPLYRPGRPPMFTPQHSFQKDGSATKSTIFQSYSTVASATPPRLLSRFPGIPAPSRVQPDSIIAAGPSRVMVAVNSSIAIFSKTGARRFQTSFSSWFASLNIGTTNLFDPRLLYDQYSGHFIFMCDARRSDHRSWYLFSVSKTSDPEGEWAFWALDMTLNGRKRVDLWADFPRIGVDKNAIYLTANMTNFTTFQYRYAKLRILKKSEVYAFANIHPRDFWNLKDATGALAFDIAPAHSFGNAEVEYMASTNLVSGNTLTLWSITGGGTNDPSLKKTGVTVSSYSIAPSAEQKGGGNRTNTGTPNPSSAVFRSGFLYTAINTALDWGSGTVSAIRFYKVSRKGVLQQEITYGADGFFYFFPAVSVDARGNIVLVFNRSSASEFIGMFYAGRKRLDPPDNFSDSLPLQTGIDNFENPYTGSNLNRWGDYNGAARDPGGSLWIYSQFVKDPVNYGTEIGRLTYK